MIKIQNHSYGIINLLKPFGLCMAVFIFSSAALATTVNIDEIRYPLEEWDHHLFEVIDNGPTFLNDSEEFLPAPYPINSSKETAKELDYLEDLAKKSRDSKTIDLIINENDGFFAWGAFEDAGIISFDNEKNKDILEILETANNEINFFILKYKKHYSRARPSQLRPALNLVIDNPRHAAYPSGHATQSYSAALILSKVDEENTEKYLDFARSIAHRREIAGVHYPSDSKAGQILAEKIVNKLLELPEFQTQLQQAKESFIKAPGLEKYEMQMTDVNFEGQN